MNASRSATAAGSSTTVYLPGSIATGRLRARRLVDRRAGELRRIHQAQLVERLRRPARAGAVRRARGEVVVRRRVAVVAEQALRRRDRLHRRLRLDEARRDDVLLLAQAQSRSRPTPRASPALAFATSSNHAALGAKVCGPSTGIASGFSGESLAISSALRTARCRLASSNCAVVTVPERLPKLEVIASCDAGRGARRRDRVAREPHVAALAAIDDEQRLVRLAHRQGAIGELFGLILRPDHDQRPVLRMLTREKRAIGQPWLTELLCDGCPLPSLNAPPSA